jgi:putative SOS response-associated peptidase YedK
MCGRVIQGSGPLRLSIVEGLDVSDSRLGNVPPRYNAAPSQELLVIRENHKTGERSLDLIRGPHPLLVQRPTGWVQAHQCQGRKRLAAPYVQRSLDRR